MGWNVQREAAEEPSGRVDGEKWLEGCEELRFKTEISDG